jgi:hypothetical protein
VETLAEVLKIALADENGAERGAAEEVEVGVG